MPPRSTSFLFVALCLLAGAPLAAAQGGHETVDTEHLRIMWKDGDARPVDVATARREGERFFAAIADLLGRRPDHRIVIMLNGPAERPDGSRGYPHVDGWGRIQLFRFEDAPESYFSALAHEMVHVFRRHRLPHHYWFFEEGFAELIAREVDGSLRGFPWYGFGPALVAGQWLVAGEVIPLRTMRANHEALNLPCKAQCYSLRASFFFHLARTRGLDAVIAMAQDEEAGALADYPRHLGADFDALAAAWEEALREEYAALEDAAVQARRYREESPAQYMPVCREGEDF